MQRKWGEKSIKMELIKRRIVLCFSLSPPVGPVGGLTIAEVDHVHLTLHSYYGLTEKTTKKHVHVCLVMCLVM